MRILVCRTDRIGDFVLSLPFIYELRRNIPSARIDTLISPPLDKLVPFCPEIDGFIIYDKERLKGSYRHMLSFAQEIKERGYDVAVALNPNLRLHILLWLSGISRRMGWAVRGGRFFLTQTIAHTKPLGLMHESRYNLLFLELLGLPSPRRKIYPKLVLPQELVKKAFPQISVGIHPHASCPSKMWPLDRFTELSKRLLKRGFGLVFLGGRKARENAEQIIKELPRKYRDQIKNRAGLNLDQSLFVIASCDVLVSNDSGPVHIASALDVPSVVIFGRNDPGLSPVRWKPLHPNSVVLHEARCEVCLAHRCKRGFACLKAITVDDVEQELDNVLIHIKLREM